MSYSDKRSPNIILFFIIIAIINSNLSQMPFLIENGLGRLISIFSWLILFFAILINKLVFIKNNLLFLILLMSLFVISFLIGEFIKPGFYFSSSLVYPFLLSMFILLVGFFSSTRINEKHFKYITLAYVLSALIVSIAVYFDSFASGFAWESRQYNYGSKNSVSQILLTAAILLITYYKPKRMSYLLVQWGISALLLLQMLMLKSRASILGILIMVILLLFFYKDRDVKKLIIIIIIIIFSSFIILNESFYELIVNNIIFGNRNSNNLNDLSSGRYSMFSDFPKLFSENPWLGRGGYYIESFPLSALIQYGILGAIPLLIIAIYPLFWAIKNLEMKSRINVVFVIIASTYIFNGFFEELTPFGPGVKNFMLWLIFGILLGWKKNLERQKN